MLTSSIQNNVLVLNYYSNTHSLMDQARKFLSMDKNGEGRGKGGWQV
jgi:hypothetical protein